MIKKLRIKEMSLYCPRLYAQSLPYELNKDFIDKITKCNLRGFAGIGTDITGCPCYNTKYYCWNDVINSLALTIK